MALITTRAEVVTRDGGRATLDDDGWHAAEPTLLEALRRHAQPPAGSHDPLYAAAQLAVQALGVRIVLLRRVPDERVGAVSKLFRALTESALQHVLKGPGVVVDDGATARRRRRRRRWIAVLLIVAGVGLVCGALLAR